MQMVILQAKATAINCQCEGRARIMDAAEACMPAKNRPDLTHAYLKMCSEFTLYFP